MILRAARLLVRLRLRRLVNMVGRGGMFRRRKGGAARAPRRAATAPKRRTSPLAILVTALMFVYGAMFGVAAVHNAEAGTGPASVATPGFASPAVAGGNGEGGAATPGRSEATEAGDGFARGLSDGRDGPRGKRWNLRRTLRTGQSPPLAPAAVHALVFIATLAVGAILLLSLATKELSTPEWDLEWLVTLPLPLPALMGVRILERAIVLPWGWILAWPFFSVLAVRVGAGWWAPLAGLAVTLPLLLLVGALRAIADTGLRLVLAPATLRNVQAALSVAGLLAFYLAVATSTSEDSFVLGWARAMPAAVHGGPGGLAVAALAAQGLGPRLLAFAGLVAECAAVAAAGLGLLVFWLRRGIAAAGARESGRRAARPRAAVAGGRRWLSAVQARELKLLGRDRTFLVQTMVLPLVIFGAQFLFNRHLAEAFGKDPQHLAALGFGFAAYTLMFSAFQTLNAEGGALWILWSVPVALEDVLKQKARVWGAVALVYPVAIMVLGISLRGEFTPEVVWLTAVALLGVPIAATVATCLGIYGCDPLAQDQHRRIKPTYAYAYFLITSTYVYALYATSLWQQLGCMVLSALVALALWQKVRERLPYLLDPAASPAPRVSVADGLIAALVFFVLQGLVLAVLPDSAGALTGRNLLVAYSVAGVVTVLAMRIVFVWGRLRDVPRFLERGALRGVVPGLAAGLGLGALGLAYLFAIRDTAWLREALEAQLDFGTGGRGWLVLLAVLAAPPVEEYIFRGLVFAGLRRSTRTWQAAAASAALFALVHTPVAVPAVFVLGLGTALVYERTRRLAAPIAAHAAYNLLVLVVPWLAPGIFAPT